MRVQGPGSLLVASTQDNMPTQADAHLRKVTLNLYDADVVWMEQTYGFGWSEKLRQLVRQHRLSKRQMTVGDLLTEDEDER